MGLVYGFLMVFWYMLFCNNT